MRARLSIAVLVACGGAASGCTLVAPLGGLTGSAGAIDGGAEVSVEAGDGRSDSSSGGADGGPVGQVQFAQCVAGFCATSPLFTFEAEFYASPTASPGCTVTVSGACSAYSCVADAGSGVPTLSAGTIRISGGNLDGGPLVMPGTNGVYDYQDPAVDCTAGQTLTITASGAVVPAFGPESLSVPALVAITTPAATDGGTYAIPTSSDLAVAWTGGQSSDFVTVQGSDSAGLNFFDCTWDAGAGQATIPRTVLAVVAGMPNAQLLWGQFSETTFDAGGSSIVDVIILYGAAVAAFQ